jgi:hypothetical protein
VQHGALGAAFARSAPDAELGFISLFAQGVALRGYFQCELF